MAGTYEALATRDFVNTTWYFTMILRVEVAGIEPASFRLSTGLLRAQPVEDFGPAVVTGAGNRS